MSEAPVLAIEYAKPGLDVEPRQRVVLRLSGIAAAAMALEQCGGVTFIASEIVRGRTSYFRGWELIWLFHLVTTPLLIGCAIVALLPNASQRIRFVQRLFLIGFVAMNTLYAGWDAQEVAADLSRGHMSGPAFADVASVAARLSYTTWSLMPPMLLSAGDSADWRRRALSLTGVTMALIGLSGISHLMTDSAHIQSMVGGSLSEGVSAALQRPLPLAGLWPLFGLMSAAALLISIGDPRRLAVIVAACFAATFCVAIMWIRFNWFMPSPALWFEWWRSRVFHVVGPSAITIVMLTPLCLLLWAGTRGKYEIFADEIAAEAATS